VEVPAPARATTPAAPLALLGPSDDEALAALAAAYPDLVAVVDDAELFLDTPAERPLLEIARRAEANGGGVLCAGTTAELASMFRGLTVEVRKHRLGVLLHPGGYGDGDLFGIRLPSGGEVVPGRGLFVDGVDVTPVQVAFPG
jgi:DNA segregation ATPase FtsK/SpoIIIE, S-DNA-T family